MSINTDYNSLIATHGFYHIFCDVFDSVGFTMLVFSAFLFVCIMSQAWLGMTLLLNLLVGDQV